MDFIKITIKYVWLIGYIYLILSKKLLTKTKNESWRDYKMAKLRKGNFILFSDGKIALVDKKFKQKQRRYIIVDEYLMSMVYYYKICYDYYPEKIYVDNKIITIISKKMQ